MAQKPNMTWCVGPDGKRMVAVNLRCVPDAAAVGQLIQNAWSRVHPQAQTVAIETPPVTQPAVRSPHDHAVTA